MKPLKAPELAVDAYIAPLASLARRAAPGEVPAMLDAASREVFYSNSRSDAHAANDGRCFWPLRRLLSSPSPWRSRDGRASL